MKIGQIEEFKKDLLYCFKNKSLVPVVGSGLSCGAESSKGKVPSGNEYKEMMIETVMESLSADEDEAKTIKNMPFSKICDLYEDGTTINNTIRIKYLKDNFFNVILDDNRKKFFQIGWPYIYTLNIDDAIENNSNYNFVIISNREVYDEIYSKHSCVIKLHGDIKDIITYGDSNCRVFSSKEYANSLIRNSSLLNKLRNDFVYQNILFFGCSLEDEIDLKTLSSLPVPPQNASSTRKFIFVKGKPSRIQEASYKTFGITDIIWFESYDEMYDILLELWIESQKISDDELEYYQNIPIKTLPQNAEENASYFYYCKYLNDLKNHIISIPYFFVERDICQKILDNISLHKIHIIYGNSVSGKSYLLIDIYRRIKDRQKLFFDGRARINNAAFQKLIEMKNAVLIFDTGTLNREQIDSLLLSSTTIYNNNSDIILALNAHDSDISGLIKLRTKESKLDYKNLIEYELSNQLNTKESNAINDLLPYVDLPIFEKKHSIIDNLIRASHIMNINGKFKNISLSNMNYKELALLIVLATKGKIYSLDIVKLSFESEIDTIIRLYSPYIDRTISNIIEKDSTDLSTIKYIVNAQYWLCRALGNFAINKNNYSIISDAYKYIITKLMDNAGSSKYRQYKACREYILFDTVNRIFLNESKGQLPLTVYLYGELHKILANDAHFLHQNAKCYFRFSHYNKNDEPEKYLTSALKMSKISLEMMKNNYEETKNEKILISQAHVQYTIASILSKLCKYHNYTDETEITETIESIYLALYSPYNIDDYKNIRNNLSSRSISNMITDMFNPDINKPKISNESNYKLSEIVEHIQNS